MKKIRSRIEQKIVKSTEVIKWQNADKMGKRNREVLAMICINKKCEIAYTIDVRFCVCYNVFEVI